MTSLTIQNLLETIREMLEAESNSPTSNQVLNLQGVPDEVMGKILEAKNSRLQINILAVSKEFEDDFHEMCTSALTIGGVKGEDNLMFWPPK
jgi:hypothetical protein